METKTLKLTVDVNYIADHKITYIEGYIIEGYVAAMICERVNAHNHTIEEGIKIENVEVCNE